MPARRDAPREQAVDLSGRVLRDGRESVALFSRLLGTEAGQQFTVDSVLWNGDRFEFWVLSDRNDGLFKSLTTVVNTLPRLQQVPPLLKSVTEGEAGLLKPALRGNVELTKVSFSYSSDAGQTLNGILIKIDAGQVAAIVGPSGSGKSTLLKLLLGFLRPDSGL